MRIVLGSHIRSLRRARAMSQEQLAEALGVSFAAVSKWERGAAVPDLTYIVEMADLFGVSVDALLGYQLRGGALSDFLSRIRALQQAKDFDAASQEAEKTLTRYPNAFSLVYACGRMYALKGLELHDQAALSRAVELLGRAIPLLPQQSDPELTEAGIRAEIAHCHLAAGRTREGIDLLRSINAGGIHDGIIGMNCSASPEYPPQEAAPYLARAFSRCLQDLLRVMTGYANYYIRLGEHAAALESLRWLIGYLESVKSGDAVSYLDKLRAPYYAECAHLSRCLGREEDVTAYLRRARAIAAAFDAAPVYSLAGMRFTAGQLPDAVAFDDVGRTALEAVDGQTGNWPDDLKALWEEIKHETP